VNNVKLGGFASDASGNLTAANSAAQLALADFTAQKYFGAASYSALTAAQRLQVATAKGIWRMILYRQRSTTTERSLT
jgi:iron complex outermembrane recepter protein